MSSDCTNTLKDVRSGPIEKKMYICELRQVADIFGYRSGYNVSQPIAYIYTFVYFWTKSIFLFFVYFPKFTFSTCNSLA